MRQFLINIVANPVQGRMSVCSNCCRLMRKLRGIGGERPTSQGVVAGTETLCRTHDGATGGRAPTYCWRSNLRGSEGAPAISMNPLGILQIAYTFSPLTFLCRYGLGACRVPTGSTEVDDADPISSTNNPSVADAATSWFPLSRERKAESELSPLGPSKCPQVFPASRETNRTPLAVDTTMAAFTDAISSRES